MSDAPGRCFLCLDGCVSVSVCLGCRTRLEGALREAERARREAEGWRRSYYRIARERDREIRRRMKK